MEPCETRGAMGLASSASQPSVAAAMVLSYLITRGSKKRKNRGALPRRHHTSSEARRAAKDTAMTTMPISATAWTSRPAEAGARGRASSSSSSSSSSRRAVVRRHGGRDGAGAMKMTRRSARVRASSPEDEGNESASASSTISALDALLGSTDEPEPEPTPTPPAMEPKDDDTDDTNERKVVITSDDAEASGWPSLSLPNLPWGASRDDDDGEDEEERAIVKRALANARADAAKTEPSMKSNGGLDYAVDTAYDPEFDPLGLGPRWEVPWGATTLIATLVAVEASFYLAGAIAPAIVYSGARNPDEVSLYFISRTGN